MGHPCPGVSIARLAALCPLGPFGGTGPGTFDDVAAAGWSIRKVETRIDKRVVAGVRVELVTADKSSSSGPPPSATPSPA